MGAYERKLTGAPELGPPDEVAIDDDHWLHLSTIGSHGIDIRRLPRPIDTMDDAPETLTDEQRAVRDEYMEMCAAAYGAVRHEIEMFIATTSIDENAELGDSAIFDTHLALNELVQNGFRHGGRPQRISVSIVNASDAYSFIPRQPEESAVQLRAPQVATAPGNRILLGVQDASPEWIEPEHVDTGDLPEHLRGLDIVRGISKAVWYQSNETDSKWVWTLI
jgi:hypothetical protein